MREPGLELLDIVPRRPRTDVAEYGGGADQGQHRAAGDLGYEGAGRYGSPR
jgi:hypothetical protein